MAEHLHLSEAHNLTLTTNQGIFSYLSLIKKQGEEKFCFKVEAGGEDVELFLSQEAVHRLHDQLVNAKMAILNRPPVSYHMEPSAKGSVDFMVFPNSTDKLVFRWEKWHDPPKLLFQVFSKEDSVTLPLGQTQFDSLLELFSDVLSKE